MTSVSVVELEREVKETRQEMEEVLERSQRVVEETTQEVVQSRQKSESLQQRLRQHQQTIQQKDQTIQQKDQTIQQKDRIIQQERQLLQQERQRVRELEKNPEGEFQRRIREMEEENRCQKLCKFCLEEEVQMVFIPCGHTVSCQECAQRLTDEKPPNQRKCPVCRKNIEGKVRLFF